MINKLYVLIVFLALNNVSFSQNEDLKSEILNKIAIESCECITQKNLDLKNDDIEKLTNNFGICVIESYTNNKEVADVYLDVSFSDSNLMRQLGEQVGIKMLNHCPNYVMALARDKNSVEKNVKDDVNEVSGEIVTIDKNQFITIEVKDDQKRVHKFLWLEYFEGENILKDFNNLKKKNAKVLFVEKELYDHKINEYRNFKVIKKISVL